VAQFSETVAIKRPPARSGKLVGQPERWFEGYLETRSHGQGLSSPVVTRLFVYWVDYPESGQRVLRRRIPSRRCVQGGPVQTLRGGDPRVPANDVAVTRGRVFYTSVISYQPYQHSLVEMTDPLVRDP